MVSQSKGLHEDRIRVTCHLPLNDRKQERAVDRFLGYLRQLRKQKLGVQGFSHTAFRPPAFFGYWWSEKEKEWVPDKIVLFMIDYQLSFNDPLLSAKVAEIKQTIRKFYRECGSPQEEVWVIAQQIIRQD